MRLSVFSLLLIFCQNIYSQTNCAVIPAPVSVKMETSSFVINRSTYIAAADFRSFSDGIVFRDFLIRFYNYPLKTVSGRLTEKNYISVLYDSTLNIPDEGYILSVHPDSVIIKGKNNGGVLHGLISLMQLFTIDPNNNITIPCCEITDHPRFGYRGMHLDCSRHFFDVDFIKKYIDYLALYKYNTFHWHLTDDQGWRIEIKQYPKLTSVGAWRNGTMVGHYREQKFDTIRYGGYYTQQQIKEIVKYATVRHITIIPEIELPGHCLAALASYPQYGCTNDTVQVGGAWGGYPDIFCPKEETFTFLENILDEVMTLFPSQYIHIGGDEVEKTQWEKSKFCQQFMKDNNLADENALQNYFIQRIGKYVNSKGKKIIGWDEILEGGPAPNAVVMSWRGEEGGIAAAAQNHYAIMTPNSHCYFDYYQGSPITEPLAIGNYIPLEKVYEYDPIPEKLDASKQQYILGAQANLWTEYITTPEHVEYMILPRMLALSEVLWTPKENKNYDDFISRVFINFKLLDRVKCNYAKSIYAVNYTILPSENLTGVKVQLSSNLKDKTIYTEFYPGVYVFDMYEGEPIPVYTKEIVVEKNTLIDAYTSEGKVTTSINLHFNKATGKNISLTTPPAKKYEADGAFTLVNGIVATTKPNWSRAEWLGFQGTECEAIIDLGKTDTISKVTVGYLEDKLSWIWIPSAIEISVSDDGKIFTSVKKSDQTELMTNTRNAVLNITPQYARYVKVRINDYGTIPPSNPGAGKTAWLFVDEISVE